jgi:hypothetical protein
LDRAEQSLIAEGLRQEAHLLARGVVVLQMLVGIARNEQDRRALPDSHRPMDKLRAVHPGEHDLNDEEILFSAIVSSSSTTSTVAGTAGK